MLHIKKLVDLDAKNITCFSQNLVQNLMSLVQAPKSNMKWLKNSNNQTMLKKRVYAYFTAQGLYLRLRVCRIPKTGFFAII